MASRERRSAGDMQQEPEDELEQQPGRAPESGQPPARRTPHPPQQVPPQRVSPPGGPPPVPADVLRDVTRLSQPPPQGADPYVLAPPPAQAPREAGPAIHDRVLAAVAHAAIIFGFLGIGLLFSLAISVGLWLYSRSSP